MEHVSVGSDRVLTVEGASMTRRLLVVGLLTSGIVTSTAGRRPGADGAVVPQSLRTPVLVRMYEAPLGDEFLDVVGSAFDREGQAIWIIERGETRARRVDRRTGRVATIGRVGAGPSWWRCGCRAEWVAAHGSPRYGPFPPLPSGPPASPAAGVDRTRPCGSRGQCRCPPPVRPRRSSGRRPPGAAGGTLAAPIFAGALAQWYRARGPGAVWAGPEGLVQA